MAYNQTRIKEFRRCQRQYSFRYDTAEILGMDPKLEMVPKVKKVQLERGSWLHSLIEAHTREMAEVDGELWEDVHSRLTEDFNELFEEEREGLGDLPAECERIFRGYLRFWRDDVDRYTVARLHNGDPAIEFVVEQSLKRWGIKDPFKGRIDLLLEDNDLGGLWIRDYKSVKNIPSDDERMMSPQNCMYVWAMRKSGYDVRGFVYDYLRTKPPVIPRVYKRTSQYGAAGTLSQRPSLDTDYYTYLQAIKDVHGSQWKQWAKQIYRGTLIHLRERQGLWYRRMVIPVENEKIRQALAEFLVSITDIENRNRKYPPRSYFYNCRWGCGYHELCTAAFAGLDIEDMIKHDYTFEDERYSVNGDLLKD